MVRIIVTKVLVFSSWTLVFVLHIQLWGAPLLSFSTCMCVCVCVLSCFSRVPSFRGSSWPRDQTCVSCLLHWQAGSLPRVPPVITDTVACQLLLFLLLETPSPLYLFTHTACSWVIPTWLSELSSCVTIPWHSNYIRLAGSSALQINLFHNNL